MIEWFDDLKIGQHFKSGEVTVSKEDILRFAPGIRSAMKLDRYRAAAAHVRH